MNIFKKPSISNALSSFHKAQEELLAVAALEDARAAAIFSEIANLENDLDNALGTREEATRIAAKLQDLIS